MNKLKLFYICCQSIIGRTILGAATSTISGAILSAFFTLLILFSEQLLVVWNAIPQQYKDMIPETWGIWIGGIVSVAMVLARLKKQPELHGGDNEKTD